jgi:hypothetical protein
MKDKYMTTSTSRTKGHHLVMVLLTLQSVKDSVAQAQTMLRQVHMVNNFGQVIEEHSVSAPVIATMRAVPEFEAATTNFPDATIYNQIPTHRSDEKYTLAMESFGEIVETKITGLMSATQQIAANVKSVIAQANTLGTAIKSQIMRDRLTLEASDITDEELAMFQIVSLDDDTLGQVFAGLENYYDAITPFNVDNLRANPEQISQELDGLSAMIADLGPVVGLELTAQGLTEVSKSADYLPSEGGFEQKGFTKAGILFALDRADSLCDSLIALADRQEEFGIALENEAKDLPTVLQSDDVTYGANEHVTLMCCYATMLNSMVRETIVMTSNLLTAIDPITDAIEAGEAEITQVVEQDTTIAE